VSEESRFDASSLMIEVEENPEMNGHLFRISSVVLSSKQRSRKLVILVLIPSFLYRALNADEF
jgi:hypothetical protein